MMEPIRMTDDDVLILMRHGEHSVEGSAALSRLVQRLAAWIDEKIAHDVYGDIDKKLNENDTSSQAGDRS